MTTSEQYFDNASALGICLMGNVPVILWGPPGNGKTSVLNAFATAKSMHMETVIASIREPADFGGLPVIDGGQVSLAPPAWAKRLAAAENGAIGFLDELSNATPAVQAAALTVILDRQVGDLHVGEQVRWVAAANPPEQAADGWDLSAPLANRFCHLDWSVPASVMREGFTLGWPEIPVPSLDPEKAQAKLAEARLLMGVFVETRPDLVTLVPSSASESGRAFPTPRSWDMAARLYATALAVGASESVITLLLHGTVGIGAANEFMHYADTLDLPNPEDLLKDPEAFECPDRGDKVYAIAASVLSATLNNMTVDRWVACGDILATIADAGHADIAYNTGRKWAPVDVRPAKAVPSSKAVASLAPILTALGR
jgi:AAA domain (dynein-related subfamily)